MDTDAVPFDTPRKALAFALNYKGAVMPRPAMTKAMAEAPFKKPSKKAAKARRDALAGVGMAESEPSAGRSFMGFRLPVGMEAAYMAGVILKRFAGLDENHQLALIASTAQPRWPCDCRSPCCSGRRANPLWMGATKALRELLRVGADVTGKDAKKAGRGLSTQPGLRAKLVEDYFTGAETSVTDMASRFELTRDTVSKHREWIWSYLDALTNGAWLAADQLFDSEALAALADVMDVDATVTKRAGVAPNQKTVNIPLH